MKLIKTVLIILGLLCTSSISYAGLYVSGGVLYEGNGSPFVIRGINHAHSWYPDKLNDAINGIASTGANTVRIVLSNGHRWNKNSAEDVENIIQLAKQNHLIAILEVHDTTGYGEDDSAANLASAADYWLEIKDKLIGQEDYIIINLGNEPFGNDQKESAWITQTQNAISTLRNAGLNHTLMVDAPNWGQDWQSVMLNNAQSVFDSDPKHNTIFSVHMYEVYGNYDTVNNYITSFINKGLALVVGEFAANHKGSNVDEKSIMERCETLNVGYIGWSWSGNNSATADLDIVNNWNKNSLTSWGNILVYGSNGINTTSKIATIYTGTSSDEYPVCSSSTSDPDGDGWGWENNQSCIVKNSNEKAPNGSPYCASSTSDPDGDGWGWENKTSCVVHGSSADR
ncbi:cellulase family glycosylhydrolase [Vibrio quintilis]|uniref:cellulase family glycosylhydrolase n=1 Tax=Vibrio quintilis TaxID=1117707 RepID=UPI0021C626E0|nr:cellulase family glycosylhydrolase [Vibrio quintilis]